MGILIAIKYLVVAVLSLYLAGLTAAWLYELRRNVLYKEMREQLRCIEGFRLSMAVLNAKKYKVLEDYRRKTSGIERVQQFIFEKVLFINRRSEGNIPLSGTIPS